MWLRRRWLPPSQGEKWAPNLRRDSAPEGEAKPPPLPFILYWLSLDTEGRALAERLLHGFAVTVGDLPASAAHHALPGGLYRHSLEVALNALNELESNMMMDRERRQLPQFPQPPALAARHLHCLSLS